LHVGGSIRFRLADLLAWIDERTENPDGNVLDGIEASKRSKTSPADLPPVTRQRRPSRATRPAGRASTDPGHLRDRLPGLGHQLHSALLEILVVLA